ncbi:phosphate/phosphite/phosphonate ABC transporter substrate-binding protein [Sphingoaurantiacus capsulatus]|uniref:Phosphate/phosphite/phosphonate ABC transporter substrate-binding protein n=1 Tax=Sphingoaurantiacus capsulatus TaxID=1771310 RepID=A0ABV7X640_9SPHN
MMMKPIRRAGAALALALAVASCGAPEKQDPNTVNFSILSTESSENLLPKWQPFLDDMAKETGLTIKPFLADDYAALIEATRFGQVQAGWYSTKGGYEAVNRAESEVFAQATYSDGVAGYYSVVMVRKDSPLKKVDDLLKCDKTLDFGMGDPNSGSGTLVPLVFLFAPRNIDPSACFKTVVNANHEANALSVVNKLIDAGTNNTTSLMAIQRSRPEIAGQMRELWRSPLLGSDVLTYRKDLDPSVKAKLQNFFVNYGRKGSPEQQKREQAILEQLEWDNFYKADNSVLDQNRYIELKREEFELRGKTDAASATRRQELAAEIVKLGYDASKVGQ